VRDFDYFNHNKNLTTVGPEVVSDPKVVSDFKWFLEYIKSGMYVAENKPFKVIHKRHLRNHKIITLKLVIWICKYVHACWIARPLHMLECWQCPLSSIEWMFCEGEVERELKA